MNYKLKDISLSRQKVISVGPKNTLQEAISKMLLNDFSQLPVIQSEGRLVGVISWKTIGVSKNFSSGKGQVIDYMDKNVTVLMDSDNLLDSVKLILEKEFIFIKNSHEKITGIITLFDIALQFKVLSEPFIELENIEASIRRLIDKRISVKDFAGFYKEPSSNRHIRSAIDLTFGDYLQVLSNPEIWGRLKVNLDREIFVEKLDEIRRIRNDVMHFRTTEINSLDMKLLKDVSRLFRTMEKMNK